ncbi:hypothetical protein ACQUSR_23970 [Streptomyces sp. P1-3]|uniref:hypothetical protein n=1 Tax=Streptomyces sp. P1-3 TaxID=3421658 RepID=UPI003D367C1B
MGIAVLVLSISLTGCGKKSKKHNRSHATASSGRSLSGAMAAEEMLPNREAMPGALSMLDGEPVSRAKAPVDCRKPSGKCNGANAHGYVMYKTDAQRSHTAKFDVTVYRNETAAKRAYRSWDRYVNADSNGFRVETINQPIGVEHIAFAEADVDAGMKVRHETVFRQGKYIGEVSYVTAQNAAATPPTLTGLSAMFAERVRQEADGETPSASAANIPVG